MTVYYCDYRTQGFKLLLHHITCETIKYQTVSTESWNCSCSDMSLARLCNFRWPDAADIALNVQLSNVKLSPQRVGAVPFYEKFSKSDMLLARLSTLGCTWCWRLVPLLDYAPDSGFTFMKILEKIHIRGFRLASFAYTWLRIIMSSLNSSNCRILSVQTNWHTFVRTQA